MKIIRIKRIDIKINVSAVLIIIVLVYYGAETYIKIVPNAPLIEFLIFGFINTLIILFSILIHELAHAFMAQRYGLVVKEIELNLIGGFTKINEEPTTPSSEQNIVLAGPISNLILGIILLIIFNNILIEVPNWLYISLFYSGISNIILAFFNLIPAFPLDGGRILRAILWSKYKDFYLATNDSYKIGLLLNISSLIYGIYLILILKFVLGFWFVFIGGFLVYSAKRSYNQSIRKSFKRVNLELKVFH